MFEINVLNTAKFKSLDYCVNAYRFGFNGKPKDDEIDGVTGSKLDFGARIYDSRIGRWLAIDPLSAKYPNLSPYCFVGNMPTVAIDPDGKDIYVVVRGTNEEERQVRLSRMEDVLNILDETTLGEMKIDEFVNNPNKNLYFAFGKPTDYSGVDKSAVGLTLKTSDGRRYSHAVIEDDALLQIGSREFDGMKYDPEKQNYFIIIGEKGSKLFQANIAGHEVNSHLVDGRDEANEHKDYGEEFVGVATDKNTDAYKFNEDIDNINPKTMKNRIRVNDWGGDINKVTKESSQNETKNKNE